MMSKWSLENNIGAETEQAENGRKGKLEKQEAVTVAAEALTQVFALYVRDWSHFLVSC